MGRIHDGELGGAIGMVGGEAPGRDAAPVVAHDMAPFDAQVIVEGGDVADKGLEVVGRLLIGEVVAALIGRDDPVARFREGGHLMPPAIPEFGKAVK